MKAFLSQVFGYFFTVSYIGGMIYIGDKSVRIIDNPLGDQGRMRMFDIMVLQSFVMAHLTICIQVNHVAKSKYSPWNNLLNIFILGCTTCVYAMSFYYKKNFSQSRALSMGMILVTAIAQWHYILNVCYEISCALGIRIFCVKDKTATL